MTITELINRQREYSLAHEKALREVANLAEKVCFACDQELFNSCFHPWHDGQLHSLSFSANGERQSKAHYAAQLAHIVPSGWRIVTDTGHEWINLDGTLGGHKFSMTVYTAEPV